MSSREGERRDRKRKEDSREEKDKHRDKDKDRDHKERARESKRSRSRSRSRSRERKEYKKDKERKDKREKREKDKKEKDKRDDRKDDERENKRLKQEDSNGFSSKLPGNVVTGQSSALNLPTIQATQQLHSQIQLQQHHLQQQQLTPSGLGQAPNGAQPSGNPTTQSTNLSSEDAKETAKKLAEIQLKIQAQLSKIPSLLPKAASKAPASTSSSSTVTFGSEKFMPPPLLLDDDGREVDPQGNVVSRKKSVVATTLINKKMQRENIYRKVETPKLETDPNKNPCYDPRVPVPKAARGKRQFHFVDPGTFVRKAERIRTQALKTTFTKMLKEKQLEAGGASAVSTDGEQIIEDANLALAKEIHKERARRIKDPVPDVEWWDLPFLRDQSYYAGEETKMEDAKEKEKSTKEKGKGKDKVTSNSQNTPTTNSEKQVIVKSESDQMQVERVKEEEKEKAEEDKMDDEEEELKTISESEWKRLVKEEKINHYVEHPIPIKPPNQPTNTPSLPLMLTKEERKKLRKRRRMEMHRERQQRVLLGLDPPPPPKVKLSNFMQVLGKEAVADPTQIEKDVRKQVEQRIENHERRNQERKLTPEQKKQKKLKKMFEDASRQINVALFRVDDLTHPKLRYKVDINAQQNYLSGCVVLFPDTNLVVVEGGAKSINRFKKLMLRRIKWTEESAEDTQEADAGKKKENHCYLVWEGNVIRPNFKGFRFEQCVTEASVRKFMKERGVEHYWDFVHNFKIDQDAPPISQL